MENSQDSAAPFLREPCGLLFILTILTWFISRIQTFVSCSCQSCNCIHKPSKTPTPTPAPIVTDKKVIRKRNKNQDDGMELTHEDITTVMRNIGLNFDQESSMACEFIGSDYIPRIFDDDEPSLHEVKQAFLVFDDNKDGYLDASDLQRVFQSLGLREGVGLDECEQMIAKYDMNKDKMIDLVEFTKVLEASVC
ncbi:hypothetical protein EJB05_30252, partial [Eragrostis curvula]